MAVQASSDDAPTPAQIVSLLGEWSRELGFQALAVARVDLDNDCARLDQWLEAGMHGDMHYLERNRDKRRHPERLVPGTLSVISVRADYLTAPPASAWQVLDDGRLAYVSRYALGRDYHKTLRQRLRRLAQRLQALIGPYGHRAFTDSAPILEKALARDAGLGWIGKHTNLLTTEAGSFFFLGEIFTTLSLPGDKRLRTNHCGSCARCIEVCPTRAIVKPYVLDARRCISYLTIESTAPIPEPLREAIGNRVFGCDDCQLVCPWNRYAGTTKIEDFAPRHGLEAPDLVDLFMLDEHAFDELTRGSALRRINHEQWLRNLAVALGNAPASQRVAAALESRRDHPSALVREHVGWAIERQRGADSLAQ